MNRYDLNLKYTYSLNLGGLFLVRLICYGGIGIVLCITSISTISKNEILFKFNFSFLTIFSILILIILIIIQIRVFNNFFRIFNMEQYINLLNIFFGYIFTLNFISKK
jgi:hypothetical protein